MTGEQKCTMRWHLIENQPAQCFPHEINAAHYSCTNRHISPIHCSFINPYRFVDSRWFCTTSRSWFHSPGVCYGDY